MGRNGLFPGLMFRGAAKITLDDKGRVVVPARYRERLVERSQGQVVVTVDLSGQCLLIYPLTDWEQVEQRIMALPTLNEQSRRLQRIMVGHATELVLDGHGRMLLPPELREIATLNRHAVLLGQGARCELWDETRWAERRDAWLKTETAAADLPPQLDALSL